MDYNELQLRAATDKEFRAELVANPADVLAREGVVVPEGVSVRVVESAPDTIMFAIPPQMPEGAELDEDSLAETAAGSSPGCIVATVGLGVVGAFTYDAIFGGPKKAPDYSRRSG